MPRVCEDCRQRNSEDRRLLCLNREILSESADGADRSVGHLGHVVDNTEEREEDRHLHEERQTRGPGAGLVVAEQIHLLFGHGLTRVLVLLALVLGLKALNLRLQQLHLALRFDLIDEQRNQDRTNHESQSRDRQHPGPTVGGRQADRREDLVEDREDPSNYPLQRVEQLVHPVHSVLLVTTNLHDRSFCHCSQVFATQNSSSCFRTCRRPWPQAARGGQMR